jgi:hypothetical protein
METTTNITQQLGIDPVTLIGRQCRKTGSGKPFKSGLAVNTIKGVINHPILAIPAFTFVEDESYVECRRCEVLPAQESVPTARTTTSQKFTQDEEVPYADIKAYDALYDTLNWWQWSRTTSDYVTITRDIEFTLTVNIAIG